MVCDFGLGSDGGAAGAVLTGGVLSGAAFTGAGPVDNGLPP